MNKYISALLFFAATLCLTGCGSDDNEDYSGTSPTPDTPSTTPNNANSNFGNPNSYTHRLEFPKVKGDSENLILVHTTAQYGVNYSVEWDTKKHAQRWSCYVMDASNSIRNTDRYVDKENQYPQDPLLDAQYQFASDPFWGSGYDHGHICPSADRLNSREANIQTFYLTNMQPQLNGFNAGVWQNMENWIRGKNISSFRDTLYIVKGGTIDNASQVLPEKVHGMIIPKYYFVAILCKNHIDDLGYKAIGLWFEHKNNQGALNASYVVNIKQLEELTGIDFFCNLPDDIERRVENLDVEKVCRAWGIK